MGVVVKSLIARTLIRVGLRGCKSIDFILALYRSSATE